MRQLLVDAAVPQETSDIERQINMKPLRISLDALGICASTLCMIHCIALPLLLIALPMWKLRASDTNSIVERRLVTTDSRGTASTSSQNQCCELECCETAAVGGGGDNERQASCCSTPTDFWIHVCLLSAVAPLGLVAWGMGYRRHRRISVLCLGFFGVLLLTGALLFGTYLLGGRGEQVMTVMGSICMVSAHLWNRRQCRCCRTPDIARLVDIESVLPSPPKFT